MKKRCSSSRFKVKKWMLRLIMCLFICLTMIVEFFAFDHVMNFLDVIIHGKQEIDASIIAKYNEKEIIVYSDTTCYFNIKVEVCDGETMSENTYKKVISEGQTLTLTLEDLAPGFFSDNAIITGVDPIYDTYIKKFSLVRDKYTSIDCSLLVKYSKKEITVFSDKSCFFDLYVSTTADEFRSSNYYRKIKIKKGETLTLNIEDLAPGFFAEGTDIKFVDSTPATFKKK